MLITPILMIILITPILIILITPILITPMVMTSCKKTAKSGHEDAIRSSFKNKAIDEQLIARYI